MIERILEPEVMDDELEAEEYDRMDFTDVNTDFATLASQLSDRNSQINVLDIGTGTARIPLILSEIRPQWQIIGVDLADSMLALGKKNIEEAGKSEQISLQLIDGKKMPYDDHSFDLVMTNSLVHHIPNPLDLLLEIDRIVKVDGSILIRDLLRPNSIAEIDKIVQEANLHYSPRQQQLFSDSLHAALTLAEIEELVHQVGWQNAQVYQSSSRHWTVIKTCTFSV
jgi:ubiquinone/menaquinone biosynthesis C-methylase UbiE